MLLVGRISGAYGLKGWIKVSSYMHMKENILMFDYWYIQTNQQYMKMKLEGGNSHHKSILAKIEGWNDRTEAELYKGCCIKVQQDQMPELRDDEVYWKQIAGFNVIALNHGSESFILGKANSLIETGANDVIVVNPTEESVDEKERLIPWIMGLYIRKVSIEDKMIIVDWQVDF